MSEKRMGIEVQSGMGPDELFPPVEAVQWNELYARTLAEGPLRTEVKMPNGETLEVSLGPIVTESGEPAISVFARNVTGRKELEDARLEGARFHREFVDGAIEGIFRSTVDGRLLSANLSLARMLGYSSEVELLSRVQDTKQDLWKNPEDRASLLAMLEIQTTITGSEQLFKKCDGTPVWVSFNCRLTRDPEGRPLGLEGFIEDISNRKEGETRLRQNEERFRRLFEDNSSVMLLMDPGNGTVVAGNDAAASFYGYSREQLMGMHASAIAITPPDKFAEQTQRTMREHRAVFRSVHRLAGGETRQVDVYTTRIDSDDQPLLLIIVHDITERLRAEEQLRESEERYRTSFEQAGIGMIHTAFDGTLLRCNNRFCETLGFTEEELNGKSVLDITHRDDRDKTVESMEKIRSGEVPWMRFEKRYIRKDGSAAWVAIIPSLQRDRDGKPQHFIATVRDLEAQKLAEQQLAETMAALRTSEERYRTTLEQAAVGMTHTTFDGHFIRCNERYATITGYTVDELRGMSFQKITEPEDRPEGNRSIERLMAGQTNSTHFEKRYRRKDGRRIWVSISTSIQRDGEGNPLHLISLVQDIDARKKAEARLEETQRALRVSEERYRMAFQTTQEAVAVTHLNDGVYVDCNNAFLDILGYEREEIVNHRATDLGIWADAEDRRNVVELLRQNSTCRNLELRFRKKNGEIFWCSFSASLLELDGVECLLSMSRDLSESKLAEAEIKTLAYFDPLTGLPNRRLLMERLCQAVAASTPEGRKRALLFLDLDNFKTLNDSLGHNTGDLLLQEVARRITHCVREVDTVARLGGDEFVVMLEELNGHGDEAAEQASMVANKVLAAVSAPCMLADHECLGTCSIGITVFGGRKEDINEVLQQADIAMYQAKAAGKNTVRFFVPSLQVAVNARASLEEEMRQGLAAGQFELWYQPQIEGGRLIGAEALVRWNHPKRGLLAPAHFINVAEETGLILPLGNWVMQAASTQCAAWSQGMRDRAVPISVNISTRQFRQPDFSALVLAALARSGANPELIRLEITESAMADNVEDLIAKMKELRAHGLRFSLDDFGTGYSSLTYLKRLPLDQLKIDRSFVQDILTDPTSGAIAQTIVSLSRALGLSVMAEGVETEQQREYLEGLGCRSFQGYLFSPPLARSEFERRFLRVA